MSQISFKQMDIQYEQNQINYTKSIILSLYKQLDTVLGIILFVKPFSKSLVLISPNVFVLNSSIVNIMTHWYRAVVLQLRTVVPFGYYCHNANGLRRKFEK